MLGSGKQGPRSSTDGKYRQAGVKGRLEAKLVERRLGNDGPDQLLLRNYCEQQLAEILDALHRLVHISWPELQFEHDLGISTLGPATRNTEAGPSTAKEGALPPIKWSIITEGLDSTFDGLYERSALSARARGISGAQTPRLSPYGSGMLESREKCERLKKYLQRLPADAIVEQPQRLGVRMGENRPMGETRTADLSRLPKNEREEIRQRMRDSSVDEPVKSEVMRIGQRPTSDRRQERSTREGRDNRRLFQRMQVENESSGIRSERREL